MSVNIHLTVFFHLCYEGAVDLDTIRDINDRHGLEVQIMEFGQIPKQIFILPHPKRLTPGPSLSRSETLLMYPESSTSGTRCVYSLSSIRTQLLSATKTHAHIARNVVYTKYNFSFFRKCMYKGKII